LGHEVRLIPSTYVKPFVKRQKNDAADAEVICEAVQRPKHVVRGDQDRGGAGSGAATPHARPAGQAAHANDQCGPRVHGTCCAQADAPANILVLPRGTANPPMLNIPPSCALGSPPLARPLLLSVLTEADKGLDATFILQSEAVASHRLTSQFDARSGVFSGWQGMDAV